MRPLDWSPLAGADPAPGDPASIGALADHLDAVAATIRIQLHTFGQVDAHEVWDSDAADVFTDAKEGLPDDLGTLATRYETVGAVLRHYGGELHALQAAADDALARARAAQADIDVAEAGIARMHEWNEQARAAAVAHNLAHPETPVEPEPWGGVDHGAAKAEAAARLAAARDDAFWVRQRHQVVAGEAALAVAAANDDELRNDGGFVKALKGASGVLGTVGGVVGVASIAVPVLAPVAGALGAASLVVDATLVVEGDGSWSSVGLDAAGVASFGLGRAFGTVADTADTAAAAGRAADAVDTAAGSGRAAAAVDGAVESGRTADCVDVAADGAVAATTAAGWPSWTTVRQGFNPRSALHDDLLGGVDDIGRHGVVAHARRGVGRTWRMASGQRGGVGVVGAVVDLAPNAPQVPVVGRQARGLVARAVDTVERLDDQLPEHPLAPPATP